MFAVYAESFSSDDPLTGLVVGERPDPTPPDGWTTVTVKAASLNHHDLWSLRGVGLKEDALPMILGCDAAGLDEDGNEVVVHAVISDPAWTGDETLDPQSLAALRAAPGHVRRQGRGAPRQRGAQAGVDELRGGRLPAHGLAHGLPDALHPGRPQGRRHRARAGRRRWRGHRADHARACRRPQGAGHQPRRGQARRARWRSAPTRSSSPVPGCRSRSTP